MATGATDIRQQILLLVQSSETLKTNPSEQAFWQMQINTLNEQGLLRLKEIFEYEQKENIRIRAEGDARKLAIDQEHLKALQEFKQVALPRFLKQWEAEQAAQESPEEILKKMDDV